MTSMPAAAPKFDEAIPFVDLQAQRKRLGKRIEEAINRVLSHGQFILGPEVHRLEEQLAAHCGACHAVACSSGTDALVLALMALRVGPGDAVFCPSFSFAATAEAVALVGATPVFVDVLAETYNMSERSLASAIAMVERENRLRPVGVIPVDLYGQPADYAAIGSVAAQSGLWVIADAAQSYGAMLDNHRVGTMATFTTTSFFPAKPLGCYGDGGAVFTDDDELAKLLRSLLFHGKGTEKYEHMRVGMNARLDTIQAAILLEKLTIFDGEVKLRQGVAKRYSLGLRDLVQIPIVVPGATSVWAQYTISINNRDGVAARLREQGIPTTIHYPKPLHRQPAYESYPRAPEGLPNSEASAAHVISLPMHPYLDPDTQARIIEAVRVAADS
jgi:dTDP-4-amino-4,6-dideoxygalactose transaminase